MSMVSAVSSLPAKVSSSSDLQVFSQFLPCHQKHVKCLVSKALLRASPAVLCRWACKYISHKSSYFFLSLQLHPTKLKLGLQIGGRLLIANPLDQSLWLTNQKQGGEIRCYALLCLLPPASENYAKVLSPKPFCWAKLAWFDFSSSTFHLQGHIFCTSGVALRANVLKHQLSGLYVVLWINTVFK
jgi:hypothetical protein